MIYDYIIIGGGIIGLATAWQLQQQQPQSSILLLEKESDFAQHQTGRNSGVIHAGVYYAPGSLKARFCRAGLAATLAFCHRYDIPYQQCGKLLVATDKLEAQRMAALRQRCEQNHIEVDTLNQTQLSEKEPSISGISALYVKTTSIVDYLAVSHRMAREFSAAGGEYLLEHEVVGLSESSEEVSVNTKQGTFRCRFLIACAGLMADRMARLLRIPIDFQIIPFRGEYYQLPARLNGLIKHLIYPIPDPALPFLGVHLTRMIDGSITVGPNALLGWKREGYGKFNLNIKDSCEMLGFPGFWASIKQQIKPGLVEFKNAWFKSGYLKQVQKYCPQIETDDLLPHATGIRAQAVLKDGSMVQDFLFAESPRSLHVCNAPSPAATSAIPIGNYICEKISLKRDELNQR